MRYAWSAKNLWERSPAWVRRVAGVAARGVPLDRLLGRRFRMRRRLLQQMDRAPVDVLRRFQIDQLRRVLVLAYDKTPYYRQLFDDAGLDPRAFRDPEALLALPTINKDTLREHLEDMRVRPAGTGRVDRVTTGGTGGEPLRFYIGADRSAIEYAHLTHTWQRAGYRLGDTFAVFRGHPVDPDRAGLRHAYDPILRTHVYSNFHMTDADVQRYLAHVRTIGPCFLHVYPSSADVLARFVQRSGQPAPNNIRGIIAESEIVYPAQRALAERAFGCRYFSCYGHSEKLVLAGECKHTTDYHVDPIYGFCELLDKRGQPVRTPGAEGEIVGTGFINTVVPFIRYRTGDVATYVGDRCDACGRETLILRRILGHRTQETLVAHDGGLISWTALNMHDDTFDHVRRFQFHQKRPGHATLRIVPAEGFDEADLARIRRRLDQKLAGRLVFDTVLCDSIPLSARGKATYVIREDFKTAPCVSTPCTS